MLRNTIIALVLATVLVPSFARAEFATPKSGDVRPAPTKHVRIPRVAVATAPRLTVDEVLQKINSIYMPGIQRCYRKSLIADPTLSGKVTLAFQVDDSGRVLMDSGSEKFDQCLARAVVGWRFTAPASETESHYRIGLVLASY